MTYCFWQLSGNSCSNLLLAFSTRRGWFWPGVLARRNPSSKKESDIAPPNFLMIWIDSNVAFGSAKHQLASIFHTKTRKLPLIFIMASTAILAKKSLCCVRSLELSVVRAMLNKSSRKACSSWPLSWAKFSSASRATATAFFQPKIFVNFHFWPKYYQKWLCVDEFSNRWVSRPL